MQDGLYNISQTAYMRYFEAQHALDMPEPFIFCDGTLVYEWLVNQSIGRRVYKDLLAKKQAIGVMKSTKENITFSWLGRALKPGEAFIHETLYEHVTALDAERAGRGIEPQWAQDGEFVKLSKKIIRGVFKPAQKHFGFECHVDHLPVMFRLMAADCQMNLPGHEIPFLLNQVDKEIRRFFKADMVQMRIQQTLSRDGEDLFFEEMEERDFR